MKLPGPPLPQRVLKQGELLVTREPQWVITVLGSCVAVTLFSPQFGLAAICHAMLPQPHRTAPLLAKPCFRYVSHAIPAMAERFAQLGLEPAEVEVKVFGGGDVIHLGGEPQRDRSIGGANVALARQLLTAARFHIKAQSVGGTHGCKIVFNTHNGEVLHQRLSQAAIQP